MLLPTHHSTVRGPVAGRAVRAYRFASISRRSFAQVLAALSLSPTKACVVPYLCLPSIYSICHPHVSLNRPSLCPLPTSETLTLHSKAITYIKNYAANSRGLRCFVFGWVLGLVRCSRFRRSEAAQEYPKVSRPERYVNILRGLTRRDS